MAGAKPLLDSWYPNQEAGEAGVLAGVRTRAEDGARQPRDLGLKCWKICAGREKNPPLKL